MRQIALDTETTGLEPAEDRIIEIACIELSDRQFTDNAFHTLINPEREVSEGAFKIHGINSERLKDESLFIDIIDKLLEFVSGAELLIHNAQFDMDFLDAEFGRLGRKGFLKETGCKVVDTLKLARERYPGQKNSLDAVCERLYIDTSARTKHNALLDAQLLAKMYWVLTSGQTNFTLPDQAGRQANQQGGAVVEIGNQITEVLRATAEELQAHQKFMETLKANVASQADESEL